MKAERIEPHPRPAPRLSKAVLADVEALRSSERLQRIFESDRRSAPAAEMERNAPDEAGGEDDAKAGRRGLLASRRMRILVGLVPLYFGVAVLAANVLGWRDGVTPPAAPAHIGAEPENRTGMAEAGPEAQVDQARRAPETQERADVAAAAAAPAPPAAETPGGAEAGVPVPQASSSAGGQAEAVIAPGAAASVQAKAAQDTLDKVSGDLVKTMDLRAVIRGRLAAARAAQAHDARTGAAAEEVPVRDAVAPAETVTVPQPTWSARATTPVPLPAPHGGRPSAAPETAARAEPETVETVPQPRAVSGPADEATSSRRTDATQTASRAASQQARIVLHYRGGNGEEIARRLASTLREQGVARTELRRVPMEVSEANVRFFYDENRPVARQVGEMLRSMGRRSEVRDFTHFTPLPSMGTVEVWLPG